MTRIETSRTHQFVFFLSDKNPDTDRRHTN